MVWHQGMLTTSVLYLVHRRYGSSNSPSVDALKHVETSQFAPFTRATRVYNMQTRFGLCQGGVTGCNWDAVRAGCFAWQASHYSQSCWKRQEGGIWSGCAAVKIETTRVKYCILNVTNMHLPLMQFSGLTYHKEVPSPSATKQKGHVRPRSKPMDPATVSSLLGAKGSARNPWLQNPSKITRQGLACCLDLFCGNRFSVWMTCNAVCAFLICLKAGDRVNATECDEP